MPRYWVGGSGNWNDTAHWSLSSGGAGGETVPGTSDAVYLDANSGGGTVTVNVDIAIYALYHGDHTGTLDFSANNNDMNCDYWNCSGTGTRTVNLGSGTFRVGSGGAYTILNFITLTNLTFNAGTSLVIIDADPTVPGSCSWGNGAIDWYDILLPDKPTNGHLTHFNDGLSCHDLTIEADTKPNRVHLPAGQDITCSGDFTCVGTDIDTMVSLEWNNSSYDPTKCDLSITGTGSMDWTAAGGINLASGSITTANCIDLGNNVGITFNTPSGGVTAKTIASMLQPIGQGV